MGTDELLQVALTVAVGHLAVLGIAEHFISPTAQLFLTRSDVEQPCVYPRIFVGNELRKAPQRIAAEISHLFISSNGLRIEAHQRQVEVAVAGLVRQCICQKNGRHGSVENRLYRGFSFPLETYTSCVTFLLSTSSVSFAKSSLLWKSIAQPFPL
jgi:hypothetical protein